MHNIHSINNKAIKTDIAVEEGYAFDDYFIQSGKPEKWPLTIDAIREISVLELDEGTTLFRERNIFEYI